MAKVRMLTSIVHVTKGSFAPGDLYECANAAEAADLIAQGIAAPAGVERAVSQPAAEVATVEVHADKPAKKHHTRGK